MTNFDSLENSLKDKKFNRIIIDYSQDYIEVGYYDGYRGAETTHKYYNIDEKNLKIFKNIVKKYKNKIDDIIE